MAWRSAGVWAARLVRSSACPLAVTVLVSAFAGAQERDSIQLPLPGANIIHGFVADSLERPLEGAEVVITSLRLSVLTGPDGTFRFEHIKPGKYQLTARKIGHYPSGRSVVVGDRGGATAFWLVRRMSNVDLPAVVTSARRGGLSGVVGDTAYNAIRDANIWVLASDRRAVSDSTGAFYLDLKPGRYMLRVDREQYGSQMISVTVPKDSGRRVMVWLSAADRGAAARQNHMILEASMRLTRRNPVWSKIYTREDITRTGMTLLSQLATAGAGHPIDPDCMAFIDGDTTRREPIWAIDAAELESVEIYTARPTRQAPRSIMGSRRAQAPSRPPRCATVFAWMRR
jgi:hypothetical protein